MGTKRESNNLNKEIANHKLNVYMLLVFLFFLFSVLIMIKGYYEDKCERISMNYLNRVEQIDQLASCYKGCQYTTQPYWNNAVDDKDFRIKQYDTCTELCEERYGQM